MWAMLEERLFAPLRSDRAIKAALPRIEAEVAAGALAPAAAVEQDRRHARTVTRCACCSIGFGPFPGAPLQSERTLGQIARRAGGGRHSPKSCGRPTYSRPATRPSIATWRNSRETGADIVLMFGLAGRRRHLCIETRARNAVSLLFPDASGFRPQRGAIAPGEPGALRGAAPFARLLGAVRSSAVPARLSRDAGRYLCNYAYWRALEQASAGRPLVQFIHIPRVLCGFAPAAAWTPTTATRHPRCGWRTPPHCAHRGKPPLTAPAG